MEFKVTFSGSSGGRAIQFYDEDVGLEGLYLARQLSPNVPVEKVAGTTGIFMVNPCIVIDESLASRARDLFARKNQIEITVPPGALNRFVKMVPVEGASGKILWKLVIQEADVITAWVEAGFPTEWMD